MNARESKLLEKIATGFFKISQDNGGSFVAARFYNPTTKEHFSQCVRDYDHADGSRDMPQLYAMPIDNHALSQWKKDNGIIFVGATVEVYKGRKIPKGTIVVVEKITPYHDMYGRLCCHYAHFTDGTRTSALNCRVI